MWPSATLHPSSTVHNTTAYDSALRDFSGTHSFGHRASAPALQKRIYDTTGQKPLSPYISDRPCSKDKYSSLDQPSAFLSHEPSGLSQLQSTLMECGKLSKSVDFSKQCENETVDKSLAHYRHKLQDHVRWLNKPCEGREAQVDATLSTIMKKSQGHGLATDSSLRKMMMRSTHRSNSANGGSVVSSITSLASQEDHDSATKSKAKGRREVNEAASMAKPKKKLPPLSGSLHQQSEETLTHDALEHHPASASTVASTKNSHSSRDKQLQKMDTSASHSMKSHSSNSKSKPAHHLTDQTTLQLGQLHLTTLHSTLNPYRLRHGHNSPVVRYSRSTPAVTHPTDPLDYKDDIFIKTISRYNAILQPATGYQATPSRKEVTEALLKLTRKQILFFHARVVEIGALVKAMKALDHPTPGLEGFLALHRGFVTAAGINTNPYVLSKAQIVHVMQRQLPWLPVDAVNRLLQSFDNTNTGILRFVRIVCLGICCLEPGLFTLAAAVDNIQREKLQEYVDFDVFRAVDSKKAHAAGGSSSAHLSHKHKHSSSGSVSTSSIATDPLLHVYDKRLLPIGVKGNENGECNRQAEDDHTAEEDARRTTTIPSSNPLTKMHLEDGSSVMSDITSLVLTADHPAENAGRQEDGSSRHDSVHAVAHSRDDPHSAEAEDALRFAGSNSSHQQRTHDASSKRKLSEREWREARPELVLLQVLHQCYAECAGFRFQAHVQLNSYNKQAEHTQSTVKPNAEAAGREVQEQQELYHHHEGDKVATIRLEDIPELFTCCANSTEDEVAMETLVRPLVQYLFDHLVTFPQTALHRAQNLLSSLDDRAVNSSVEAHTILKHADLRTMFATQLFVSLPDLFDGVLRQPLLLREFTRQVRNYRRATAPYLLQQTQTSIRDAISHFIE